VGSITNAELATLLEKYFGNAVRNQLNYDYTMLNNSTKEITMDTPIDFKLTTSYDAMFEREEIDVDDVVKRIAKMNLKTKSGKEKLAKFLQEECTELLNEGLEEQQERHDKEIDEFKKYHEEFNTVIERLSMDKVANEIDCWLYFQGDKAVGSATYNKKNPEKSIAKARKLAHRKLLKKVEARFELVKLKQLGVEV